MEQLSLHIFLYFAKIGMILTGLFKNMNIMVLFINSFNWKKKLIEIKAYSKENPSPVLINFNSIGNTILQMESGSDKDFNRIYLYVNVIDDFGGSRISNISEPITVLSNIQFENKLISQIACNNKSSVFMQNIITGSIQYSNNIISIGNILNQEYQCSNYPNVNI